MAQVISFINFKGGVGKTTLCVETAAALTGHFNAKVLLVDLDPQTNATLSLLTEREWHDHAQTKGTLKEFFLACLEGKSFDLRSICFKYSKHWRANCLHILPSHLELFGIDLQIAQKFGHAELGAKSFLRNALKDLQADYDFILIDCPPNLYLATQNGLFCSQQYVIVALAEYLSTLGLAHIQKSIQALFTDMSERLKTYGGSVIPPALLGIIFNRVRYVSGGTSGESSIMEQIRKSYGEMVFEAFVSQSQKIADRPAEKIPIAFSGYAADRAYENQMRRVAEEFYDRVTRP